MSGFPTVLTRPAAVLSDMQRPGDDDTVSTTLRHSLDGGVPTRIPLSGNLMLVLSVGLGRARPLMETDPSVVIVSAPSSGGALSPRDPDLPIARLSLVDGAILGDSVPVIGGVPMTMTLRGRAVVEIIVDAITLTAGSLRSPGKYGSSLTLRWRDVTGASDDGPKPPLGDESIPPYSVLGKKASLGGVS